MQQIETNFCQQSLQKSHVNTLKGMRSKWKDLFLMLLMYQLMTNFCII